MVARYWFVCSAWMFSDHLKGAHDQFQLCKINKYIKINNDCVQRFSSVKPKPVMLPNIYFAQLLLWKQGLSYISVSDEIRIGPFIVSRILEKLTIVIEKFHKIWPSGIIYILFQMLELISVSTTNTLWISLPLIFY